MRRAGQDVAVQAGQLRAGFDAELVAGHLARLGEGGQCRGAVAATVEGEHEVAPGPFAQRVALQVSTEQGDQLSVFALV